MTDRRTTALQASRRADRILYRLEVSRYDRVAGLLISLLVLLGAAVLLMFILWLTNRIFVHHTPPPVLAADLVQSDEPWGVSNEIQPPDRQETDIFGEDIEDTLSAVFDAVADRSNMISKCAAGEGTDRGGASARTGPQKNTRNWELQFIEGNTLDSYARQLDFFKIELGIVHPDGKIEYAYNLSAKRPLVRNGTTDDEKRYYLTWQRGISRRGNLQQADRALLSKAGIDLSGNQIFKFLTPEVEAMLHGLEQNKAAGRTDKIRMTRFGILPDGEGYKFYVMRQTYR